MNHTFWKYQYFVVFTIHETLKYCVVIWNTLELENNKEDPANK